MANKSNIVCFNDLSVEPYCCDKTEAYKRADLFVDTVIAVNEKFGVNKVCYHTAFQCINLCNVNSAGVTYTLQDYCTENFRKNPKVQLLLSMQTRPQVDEDNDAIVAKCIDTNVTIDKNGISLSAYSFIAAYIQNTFCVGFQSEPFWQAFLYNTTITDSANIQNIQWGCVSHPNATKDKDFIDWYESLQGIELIESTIHPSKKARHFRQDHGIDKLNQHADRVLNCPYVEGIINSLPFHPNTSSYIHQVKDKGIIEVTLYWTDNGIGMTIQTTGRNKHETYAIAEILKKKYGHK